MELRYIKALSHLKLGLTDVGKRKGHTHWFAATYDLRLCSVLLYNILRRILHYDVSNVETKCNDFDFSTESQALKKASSLTFDGNGQRKQTTEARLVIRRLRHIQVSMLKQKLHLSNVTCVVLCNSFCLSAISKTPRTLKTLRGRILQAHDVSST